MIAAALVAAVVGLAPGSSQSFESVSGLPKDWKLVEYNAGVSKATVQSGDAADGSKFLHVESPTNNHARIFIPTEVEANATYRFSAQVRASGSGEVPAVLMLEGSTVTTEPIPGDGKWRKVSLFITPGSSEKITPELSLGQYGNVVTGSADFDDVSLEKVDTVPDGGLVAAPSNAADGANADGADQAPANAKPQPKPKEGEPTGWAWPLFGGLVVLAAGVGVILRRGDDDDDADD